MLEARQPFRGFSYKLVEKSGITNWVSVSGEPVFDDAGRFTGYRGIGTYVTGLVTVKEALRESEARFRALLALSSDWYWELDEHLRYRSLSASAPVSAAASLGRQPWELPWTGKSEADWARHRSDLAGHRAFHDFELSIVDGAGGVRWMSLDGEPVFDSTGAFSGYRGVGRNITQERAAQETLRASERMLSLITDNVPAMIAYFDAGLRCRFANPRFARTFGVAHEEVAGRHLHEIVGAQAYADIAGFFGQVLARSEVRFEHRFALPDGQSRYFQTSLVPDRDANGMISGCYALFSDITDYKAVEDQIRRMNLELEHRVQERTRQLMAANKEMEAFSYSVSHDLQAPLRRIERYAELLTESSGGKLDEQGREMLGRIQDATAQTNQLIADVMKLSRISRTDIARTAVDVSLMAREALDHIAAAGTPPRDVRLSIEPGITTDADPALLRILLDNLLGNAWKFTGRAASPAIEVGALDEPHGRGFFVRDNGAGFDMRFAYKLFGAFQRLHGQSEFKGSGIGLAMVQRIVNLHGWQISAEAEPGKGATFRVKTK
jgi:PAS domain S-box-containing protein